MTNGILQDILPEELTKEQIRVISSTQFNNIITASKYIDKTRSIEAAKTLPEFYGLVKNIITNDENLNKIVDDAKIFFTEEEPDFLKSNNVTITVSLDHSQPGEASSAHNVENKRIRDLIPRLREEIEDPENPGYKRAIMGVWRDNYVRFTIWARTNKVANERALWFEGLMQEYRWYFGMQGIPSITFEKREQDTFQALSDQKLYARPLIYRVRTETLTTISQKKIEQIIIGSMSST